MNKNHELYYDEIDSLRKFRAKIETHAIYKEDLDSFSDEYEELVAQAKVITRVSDRLQKKLDNANMQIREQNDEIKDKNVQLADTVTQLAKAKVGRKASTILLTVAVVLFILEQLLLEPIIDQFFDTQFVSLGILGLLFLLIKFSEGALESYFMNREKKKILEQEKKEESGWS
jgi:membrane-bound ClpP family serine protease